MGLFQIRDEIRALKIVEGLTSLLTFFRPKESQIVGVRTEIRDRTQEFADESQNVTRAAMFLGYILTRQNYEDRDRYAMYSILNIIAECIKEKELFTRVMIADKGPVGDTIKEWWLEKPFGWLVETDLEDIAEEKSFATPNGETQDDDIISLMNYVSTFDNWLKYEAYPKPDAQSIDAPAQSKLSSIATSAGAAGTGGLSFDKLKRTFENITKTP